MTREELLIEKAYIEQNTRYLTPAELMRFYEKYLHGADGFLLGAEFDEMVYGYYTDTIPLKYCSCQYDSQKKVQYLRFRPHQWGAQEIATREDAICFGDTATVYTLYTCNTKKGYNSGYCFEKAVYARYGMEDRWVQDNKPSSEGGDISLNGKEYQLKYCEKESLATITNTKKILAQIDKILKVMEG